MAWLDWLALVVGYGIVAVVLWWAFFHHPDSRL